MKKLKLFQKIKKEKTQLLLQNPIINPKEKKYQEKKNEV
jgi:hypothetical protein